MMTGWSHLPNAVYIDRIIADVNARPDVWADCHIDVSEEVWDKAYELIYADIWPKDQSVAWGQAWRMAAQREFWPQSVALGGILALIVWDHSSKYLTLPLEHVKLLGALTNDPAAILLYPAASILKLQKK